VCKNSSKLQLQSIKNCWNTIIGLELPLFQCQFYNSITWSHIPKEKQASRPIRTCHLFKIQRNPKPWPIQFTLNLNLTRVQKSWLLLNLVRTFDVHLVLSFLWRLSQGSTWSHPCELLGFRNQLKNQWGLSSASWWYPPQTLGSANITCICLIIVPDKWGISLVNCC